MSAKKLASNIEWQYWGRIDPLFGAAPWAGKAKAEGAPWTDDEFYKLGESDWQDFASHWERYGFNRENCVEIGCGPGRITMQLAKCFRSVDAVDVARAALITPENTCAHLRCGFIWATACNSPSATRL